MMTDPPALEPLCDADYDELDQLLEDLRSRDGETPQWEFFEGAVAALVCCRRRIAPAEYLPMLLPPMDSAAQHPSAALAQDVQWQRFDSLLRRRMAEVDLALRTPIDNLDDERSYLPVLPDLHAGLAALTPLERAELGDVVVPALAQVWAIGFMYVVESWPQEWLVPPALGRETSHLFDQLMQCIVDLTEDEPALPVGADATGPDPVGVSEQRQEALGNALWAVYDLYALWHQIGERVPTRQRSRTPARNEPCSCGSGKKYKKCCGAA